MSAIERTIDKQDADSVRSRLYAWTQEQVRLLQQHVWTQLDVANLIEEIESLGKQQRQELRNRLGMLLGHLLKWQFQAEARIKSWFATIREQRGVKRCCAIEICHRIVPVAQSKSWQKPSFQENQATSASGNRLPRD